MSAQRSYGAEDRARVRRLAPLGPREISRQTGIPANTIAEWLGPAAKKPRSRKKPLPRTAGGTFARDAELLGSVSARGAVHAAYPTADRTVCGVRFGDAVPDPRGPAPDCVECAALAEAYDAIDGSAPPSWRKAR